MRHRGRSLRRRYGRRYGRAVKPDVASAEYKKALDDFERGQRGRKANALVMLRGFKKHEERERAEINRAAKAVMRSLGESGPSDLEIGASQFADVIGCASEVSGDVVDQRDAMREILEDYKVAYKNYDPL